MLAGRHPYNGNSAQEAHRAGLEPARIAETSRTAMARARQCARRPSRRPHAERRAVPRRVRRVAGGEAAGRGRRQAASRSRARCGPRQRAQLAGEHPRSPRASSPRARCRPSPRAVEGFPHAVPPVRADRPRRRGLVLPRSARRFGTDLMATVETEMDRIRAADESPAAPAADAPLTQAPAVTTTRPRPWLRTTRGRTVVTEPSASAGAAPEAAPAAVPTDAAPPPPCRSRRDRYRRARRRAAAYAAGIGGARPRAAASRQYRRSPPPCPPTRHPLRQRPRASRQARRDSLSSSQALSVREGDVAARIVIRRSGDSVGHRRGSPGQPPTARPLPTASMPTSARASSASSQARRAARSTCRSRTTQCPSRRGASACCSKAARAVRVDIVDDD